MNRERKRERETDRQTNREVRGGGGVPFEDKIFFVIYTTT